MSLAPPPLAVYPDSAAVDPAAAAAELIEGDIIDEIEGDTIEVDVN
jgi:hypothetical protein